MRQRRVYCPGVQHVSFFPNSWMVGKALAAVGSGGHNVFFVEHRSCGHAASPGGPKIAQKNLVGILRVDFPLLPGRCRHCRNVGLAQPQVPMGDLASGIARGVPDLPLLSLVSRKAG